MRSHRSKSNDSTSRTEQSQMYRIHPIVNANKTKPETKRLILENHAKVSHRFVHTHTAFFWNINAVINMTSMKQKSHCDSYICMYNIMHLQQERRSGRWLENRLLDLPSTSSNPCAYHLKCCTTTLSKFFTVNHSLRVTNMMVKIDNGRPVERIRRQYSVVCV